MGRSSGFDLAEIGRGQDLARHILQDFEGGVIGIRRQFFGARYDFGSDFGLPFELRVEKDGVFGRDPVRTRRCRPASGRSCRRHELRSNGAIRG